MKLTADEVIRLLDLRPHPEGGSYRETWKAPARSGERAAGTAIYYLLSRGEISHWHKVDADEIWHWYAGSALVISVAAPERNPEKHVLGTDLASGQRPQIVVPRDHWQSASCLGDWTLVGCTVSPGFQFEGFEMAPAGWAPSGS